MTEYCADYDHVLVVEYKITDAAKAISIIENLLQYEDVTVSITHKLKEDK